MDKVPRKELILIIVLATIQFSHILDFVVLMPLAPILMRELSISASDFAFLVSSYNFSAGLFGFLFASVADKYDRKKSLIWVFIGFILGTIFCSIADNASSLIVARIIAGAFGGILTSIVYAIVAGAVPFERRGRAMGIILSSFSVSSVLGVPLGLFIGESFGWHMTFVFIAMISIIALLIALKVVPSLKVDNSNMHFKQNLKHMFDVFINIDYIKSYLLLSMNVFAIFMLIPFLAPYAVKNVGLLESDLKYIYLVGGIFSFLSARAIGIATDKFSAIRVIATIVLLSFIPILTITNMSKNPLWYYIIISGTFMVFASGRAIPIMTLVTQTPKDDDRGAFMSILNSLRALATSFATIVASFFLVETEKQIIGYNNVGLLSVAFGLLTIYIAFVVNRRLKL
ncbi:MAG: MFS transporter [Bacteriovoracaceae bacterium]|nr:MFS transporter [Bacteriovoracaceae bacterium]